MSDGLERFALLAGMSQAERRALAERLDWLDVAEGGCLFDEGDPADGLWMVLEGRVRLTSSRRGADGEIGSGGTLGALSLVMEGPREARAEARCRCRLLRLTRASFEGLRQSAPGAACALLEGIVRENAVFTRDALAHLRD